MTHKSLSIPNRTSPPAYLVREAYREGEKVKKRTLANISHWPIAKIEALRRVLRGDFSSGDYQRQELTLLRSLPHGHVAAALGMLRNLKLDSVEILLEQSHVSSLDLGHDDDYPAPHLFELWGDRHAPRL